MKKVILKLTRSQVRDAAMRKHGLDPARLALKPGMRIESNRKHAANRGRAKHKKEPCTSD
jgi:hypothetical protein